MKIDCYYYLQQDGLSDIKFKNEIYLNGDYSAL